MPRLRYRKDFDGLSQQLRREASTWEEPSSQSNTDEGESPSGQSWLSNSNIIASLPDQKLRASIDYHRAMLRLLEQELYARLTTGRKARVVDYHFGAGTESTGAAPSNNGSRKRAKKLSKIEKLIQQCLDAGIPIEALRKFIGS